MVQTNSRLRADLKKSAEHACIDLDTSIQELLNEGLEMRLALIEGPKALERVVRRLSGEGK